LSISDIPERVRYLLWAKSAGRCEFDGCNQPLWRDGLTQIEMNFADVAHIIGDSPKGPRGEIALSKEYCNNSSNLMLMCQDHHRMIDEITNTYTIDALRQMKQAHEERIELLTEIRSDKTSYVIIYTGSVGEIQPKIEFRDAIVAMQPGRYPARHLPIVLGMSNSKLEDNEEVYWQVESTNLERQFTAQIRPFLASNQVRNHFSVFAFAPQPLLIKLGVLLSDLYPADVYQLHREPPTWEWQPRPEKFEYLIKEPETEHPLVALNLSLSATIDSQRIARVLAGQKYSEWLVTIPNPNNDYLKSRGQLQLFRKEYRLLLDKIKAKHGENAVIHIFPAVPVSVAVEIGHVRQPKADLPFVIYDQNNKMKGFHRALSIGDANND
jgi:hypothetical protein